MAEASLTGKTTVVGGASRGAGRGIALALGDAGATVYVVGRTTRRSAPPDALGTIDDTARDVTERGGRGIPVRADCRVVEEVEAVFRRVEEERGALDVLANAVWGASDGMRSMDEWMASWTRPFWEQPADRWHDMMDGGPRAYFLMSRAACRIMARSGGGLIVGVTDYVMSDDAAEGGATEYAGHLLADLAHRTIDRLMFGIAREGAEHGIAAIALMPGFMRTETVEALLDTEALRDRFSYSRSESTEYLGRAVAALATDPGAMEKTERVQFVADLAREYGFTDVDGRRPPRFDPHTEKESE